ncbi:hypothetical protein HJP15_20415 [Pseudoalteromonas sp. NEC-BIFX-2020_002]|uniref:hypothetical protein n=1 Tax=Pseudoalteromonas sp. NEC-BIFX-2020_002 TaxID=2732353 RepID=UPI00147769F9|nr:hypothetical protein [Pseudoalteromonas sp. NEC-BIFX-2020_002]NNG45253.1 hypothetical protein [Pseudoalteromonas sp. NEC-BIFX-2020_002]
MNSRRDKFLAQKSKLSSAVLFAQLKWLSSLFIPASKNKYVSTAAFVTATNGKNNIKAMEMA